MTLRPFRSDWLFADLASVYLQMDKQMVALYQFQKLSNLETKLRFLACQQLELALSGLFPQAEVVPFGSSVNQFGAHTTDLDMMVNFSTVSQLFWRFYNYLLMRRPKSSSISNA